MPILIDPERLSVRATFPGKERQADLLGQVESEGLMDALTRFMTDFEAFFLASPRPLVSGETVPHGSWMTRWVENEDGALAGFEYSCAGGGTWVPGLSFALRLAEAQLAECAKRDAHALVPRGEQMVAVSEGVMRGDVPLRGIRYMGPTEMSGWYLTTSDYDGDAANLHGEHMYEVVDKRPDIARLLALPPGWWFSLEGELHVGFDEGAGRGEA